MTADIIEYSALSQTQSELFFFSNKFAIVNR
jgi:hypothetical protein